MMAKHYSIKDTTKEERNKIVKEALAISTLDAPIPEKRVLDLMDKYIEGKLEIKEILEKAIGFYKVQAN